LNDRIREYEDAKTKKKKLEETLSKITFRNKELIGDFELQEETAQNDFTWKSKKLDETISEKNLLETDIKKNARILENMLGKIFRNKVRIVIKLGSNLTDVRIPIPQRLQLNSLLFEAFCIFLT
jgi:hypothetical protein